MILLKRLWRLLDDLQRLRWVRVALSLLVLAASLGTSGWIYGKGAQLRADGQAVMDVLRDANLTAADPVAVEFAERGTVTIGNRVFGGQPIAGQAKALYGEDGKLISALAAAQLAISDRVPTWLPAFLIEQPETTLMIGVILAIAGLLTVWTGLTVPFLLTALAALVACIPFWIAGSLPWIIAVSTQAALLFGFALLVRTAAMILGGSTPVLAIASNVLRESLRNRVATAFVVTFLVVLPLLPIWISPSEPLRYQVQTFLSRSTGLWFFLASCMTVFLACATVAFEIRDRQIWQVMTKPVARFQFLMGKWLGVVTLNVLLALVGGVAVFLYVQALRARPAADLYDSVAVREEVLVARQGSFPTLRRLDPEQLRELVDRRLAADPLLADEIDRGGKRDVDVKRELARDVAKEFAADQRAIAPGAERTYTFAGLSQAKRLGGPLTLRYAFDVGRIDPHEVHAAIFKFPDGRYSERRFVPGQSHVMTLPSDLIDEKGELALIIENAGLTDDGSGNMVKVPGQGTLLFQPDAIEVLYRVDGFEMNFLRAMLVNLLKLAFLAMLGVAASTVLSFPVAAMLAFTVFAIGSLAPFLGMSLAEYGVNRDAPLLWQWFQHAVKVIAGSSEWLLRGFGEIRPNQLLVEGRLVPWSSVGGTLLVIGVVWTGGVFLLGYLAFRRKELAVYSGGS